MEGQEGHGLYLMPPPVQYRHWTGRMATLPRARELEAGWPGPVMETTGHSVLIAYSRDTGPWINLGWAPASRNRWERFWRHWHHGRLMGYPRRSVLAFCLTGLRIRR